jgi:hypothetical protein
VRQAARRNDRQRDFVAPGAAKASDCGGSKLKK